jgi:hypothetical protein
MTVGLRFLKSKNKIINNKMSRKIFDLDVPYLNLIRGPLGSESVIVGSTGCSGASGCQWSETMGFYGCTGCSGARGYFIIEPKVGSTGCTGCTGCRINPSGAGFVGCTGCANCTGYIIGSEIVPSPSPAPGPAPGPSPSPFPGITGDNKLAWIIGGSVAGGILLIILIGLLIYIISKSNKNTSS